MQLFCIKKCLLAIFFAEHSAYNHVFLKCQCCENKWGQMKGGIKEFEPHLGMKSTADINRCTGMAFCFSFWQHVIHFLYCTFFVVTEFQRHDPVSSKEKDSNNNWEGAHNLNLISEASGGDCTSITSIRRT